MREVALQSRKKQTGQRIVPFLEKRAGKETTAIAKKKFHTVRRELQRTEVALLTDLSQKERVEWNLQDTKRKRDAFGAPLCLDPTYRSKGKRHYISNCDVPDPETKTALPEHYCKAKKACYNESRRDTGNIRCIAYMHSSPIHQFLQHPSQKDK